MLEEYKFCDDRENILSIFYNGQENKILVSKAKELIRERIGTNAEITIKAKKNEVSKENNNGKQTLNDKDFIFFSPNFHFQMMSNDLIYTYSLTENNVTSAERSKYTISCITDADERECWTSDEEEGENESDQEKDSENDKLEKESQDDYKKYLEAVERQRNSFIDETEGVFKVRYDPKNNERVELIQGINNVIDIMIKDAKKYENDEDIAKHFSHAEYSVKDYHPGSNDVVLDIIHPSLFSYIRNETKLIQKDETIRQLDMDKPNSKKQKRDRSEIKTESKVDDAASDLTNQDNNEAFDMWGRR